MNHPHPNLSTPPALVDGGLRIVALGGLTEIGRNMTVFEYKSKLLIVDCEFCFLKKPTRNRPYFARLLIYSRSTTGCSWNLPDPWT
jgi:predicted metal-dependent RNase